MKKAKRLNLSCFTVSYGSIERFIGILIEHYGGAFPTWLCPVQVSVLPVNGAVHGEYAKKVADTLHEAGIRVKLNDENEKLGYRLRNSVVKKIPFTLVIGDKEVENGTVTYRVYGKQEQTTVSLDEFKALVLKSIKDKARY